MKFSTMKKIVIFNQNLSSSWQSDKITMNIKSVKVSSRAICPMNNSIACQRLKSSSFFAAFLLLALR